MSNRYRFLERQLDRDDLTDEEFDLYNKELNDLQDARNAREAKQNEERQHRIKEQMEAEAHEKALAITDAEVDQMYKDFHIVNAGQTDANGRTFQQWFDQSLSLYRIETIDSQVKVISRAKGEVDYVIDVVSVAHGRSRILDLIKTKFRDHHLREDRQGCDFKHIP